MQFCILFFFNCSLLGRFCCSTFSIKILQSISIGFKSDGILNQVNYFTSFYFKNSCVILAMCMDHCHVRNHLSWQAESQQAVETESHLFIQCFGLQTFIHRAIYKCHLPKTFYIMQPDFSTLSPPRSMVSNVQSLVHAKHDEPIWSKQIYLCFIWPKNVLPILIRLLVMFVGKA